MARSLAGQRLVVASHNAGKVREIEDLLSPFGVETVGAATVDLPEPVEDGDSYAANALIKARAATAATGMVALSDDSGLSVAALGGAPGIYSARWADGARDFAKAMRRVEDELAGHSDRTAAFICCLALAWPDDHTEVFRGEVGGHLVWPPRGDRGFGYDPMFMPDARDDDLTFGELPPEEKHAISHRADAFRKLVAACFA